MEEHVFNLAEPVGGIDVDPHVVLGLLIAAVLVYVVVCYFKVVLAVLAVALLAILVIGISQLEPLIAHALGVS